MTPRRTFLTGTAGVAVGSVLPAAGPDAAAASSDAKLIALCREAVRNHAETAAEDELLEGMKFGSSEWKAAKEVIYARTASWHALCADIAATPASTLEGMKAKAAVLADVIALEEPLVASLCLDLLGRDPPGLGELLEAENPDAALLADCAAFDELERAYCATNFRAEADTPEADAAEAEQQRIAALQRPIAQSMFAHVAVTRAGQSARARSLVGWAPDLVEDGDADIAMLLTHAVLRDLVADGVTGHVEREAV